MPPPLAWPALRTAALRAPAGVRPHVSVVDTERRGVPIERGPQWELAVNQMFRGCRSASEAGNELHHMQYLHSLGGNVHGRPTIDSLPSTLLCASWHVTAEGGANKASRHTRVLTQATHSPIALDPKR